VSIYVPTKGKGRSDWETPQWLFDRLHAEFRFDIDAAASDANRKLPRYWTPENDGLAREWSGLRVWCNPPYGRWTQEWARKAFEETRARCPLAVLLVPANTETAWWRDYALAGCSEIRFVDRRVHFTIGGKTHGRSRPVFSSAVLVFDQAARNGHCIATTLAAPDPRSLSHGRLKASVTHQAVMFP
jgi:phage N-6-adenine-methyltransferase